MRKNTPGRVVPAIPLPLTKRAPPAKAPRAAAVQTTSGALAIRGKSDDGEHKAAGTPADVPAPAVDERKSELAVVEVSKASVDTPVSPDSAPMSLSNGHTSDAPFSEAPAQPTPPTNGVAASQSPAVTAGNGSTRARKLTESFDMRHIRTELPPAFIPSAEQHTPQSASSQTRPLLPALPHAHPTHPSASSIVFGGQDSSRSSPAPPPNGAAFAPPQHANHAPTYSHSHHMSEPPVQRMYQSTYPPQPPHWAARQGHGPPPPMHHPHGHMPFRYPPRESFTPGGAAMPNGYGPRSRSGSRASSVAQDGHKPIADLQSPTGMDHSIDNAKAIFPESKAAFPAPGRHPAQFRQHMPPPPPPNFPHPEIAASMENAESIRVHAASHFRDSELADCQLQILEEEGSGREYFDGHKIILARSPKLLEIVRNSKPPASASHRPQVHILLTGRYVRLGPFTEALRYLYGGPLPPFEPYSYASSNNSVEERVELALQYIGTGAWLGIHAFAHRGVEIAASLLNWDTISPILAFALDGGLGQMWPIDDGSEERTSTCSSDDSMGKPEAGGSPTYDPFATALLTRAIEFTAVTLPPSFYLDPAAPQSVAYSRLPTSTPKHESRPSRSDPRLSKIRFGEVPIDDHQRPSLATTTISSILLSLPFPLLKYLLEHPALTQRLGAETVASIMRTVVNEREVRRQKALKTRSIGQDDEGIDVQSVQNLYWEETVEPSNLQQHRAGFRLARRRRGIDTPPSSGAESERNK